VATGRTCPNCGSSLEPGVTFCAFCSSTLAYDSSGNATLISSLNPKVDVLGDMLREATLGDFDIYGELGRGGMAGVYLALELSLNRKVAIKALLPELLGRAGMVQRFKREAQTAAGLSHPHIVQIFSVRETKTLVYFVMKYLEGRSLEWILSERGALDLGLVRSIVSQAGSALAYAHRKNIVHRDFKPANIMIDEDGWAILTDFGIAKVQEAQNLTSTGTAIGTPHYMSPEQFHNKAVTGASDQYSLGLVAYEMLSGKKPYDGDSFAEVITKHLFEPVPDLRAVRPDIPEDVARAVMRMMAKEPADRFPDVESAIAAFAPPQSATGSEVRTRPLDLTGPQREIRFEVPISPIPQAKKARPASSWQPNLATRLPLASIAGIAVALGLVGLVRAILSGDSFIDPSVRSVVAIGAGALLFFAAAAALVTKARRARPYGNAPTTDTSPQPQPPPPVPPPAPRSARPSEPPAGSTSILDSGWAPKKPAESSDATSGAGPESTGVWVMGGGADSAFPVALMIDSAANQSLMGQRVECRRFPFRVGRNPDMDLSIAGDELLSGLHAELDKDADGFIIRDKSRNGIFVDGRRLHDHAEPLRIGARIQLTPRTSLKFVAHVPMLPDLTGRILDNRYRLDKLLHESVKASTYLAFDKKIPHSLALKVFSPSLMRLQQYRVEFRRQAELAAKISHPHICKIMDWGETSVLIDNRTEVISYQCTEYMRGGNLATRLQGGDAPTPTAVAEWIADIASALQKAHECGIVHGDLKPSCILFDDKGIPYLTDFALAVDETTTARTVIGSPDYLAPEQWERQATTARSDQYSLAVVTYLLLTGRHPYTGQADPAVRSVNFERGAVPVHEEAVRRGRPPVSRPVSDVITRAMSVAPELRFPSVAEFSDMLGRAVRSTRARGGEPRVFFSYHRKSGAGWAALISSALRPKYSVFIDTQATDGAPQIPVRIRDEIRDCDVFVCLLSPETLESKWVRQEINHADKFNKPMVPIFQEEFRPKEVDVRNRPGLRRLLNYDAVLLLDRSNAYVDEALVKLKERIEAIMKSS
jgi:serine/threonine protein kinase